MKERGFTIVELLVVLVVIGILLTLGTVSLKSSLSQARDNERHTDIENIVNSLEGYYKAQHSGIVAGAASQTVTNTYPGTEDILQKNGSYPEKYITERTSKDSFYAPGADKKGSWSLIGPQPDAAQQAPKTIYGEQASVYVYSPLTADGSTCLGAAAGQICTSFTITYALENPKEECPPPSNTCTKRSLNR